MKKVADIRGFVLDGTRDANELRRLVQRVSKESWNTSLGVAKHMVGHDHRVQEVMKLLEVESNGPRVLILYGVSGVGKTTLAKTLFKNLVGQFGCRSFIASVRENLSKNDGLISMQNKIISDLSPRAVAPSLNDFSVGISETERIVHENGVLLVLDDVANVNQLDTLIDKKEWFYEGSLIIITTRDRKVLPKSHVHLPYEVKELESSEALELFSYHALGRKEPTDNFLNYSRQIVSLIGGLPLALKVFGSFLFDKRRVEEWIDALGQLRQIHRGHLQSVLKISFDGLDEEERCIFLNVASLFIQKGINRDDAVNILRCYGFKGERVINVLKERFFIKITKDNMLWMHDAIKDMGREIVLADSAVLGRLWDPADILAFKGEKGLSKFQDMAGRIDFVDEINPNKVDWKIYVRIIRLWTRPDYMNSEKARSIQMVLMDKRGGRIHATIKGHLVSSFKSEVNEGGVYHMRNFEVEYNNGKYRTSRHKFKLNFSRQTTITKSECEIPKEGFMFMPFVEIGSLKDDTFLIDVIGEVVGNGNIIEEQSKGKKTRRMGIELRDLEGYKLKCIFWDKYAYEMHSFLAEGKAGPIIVIIQLARVKVHDDGVETSNEYFGTKLLINSNVTTATEYRDKILHRKDSLHQRSSEIRRWLVDQISKNSRNVENKMTIDEILKALQPMICVTLAKISEIETRYSWWYNACKRCSTKVKQHGSKFFCKKCDKFVESAIPRFKVRVKIDDGTGSTSFIIFDPEASQIIGKSATDIRQRIIKDGAEDMMYPAELYELLEKKYLFIVRIKGNWHNYSVPVMMDGHLIENFLPAAAKQDTISNDMGVTLLNKTPSKRLYSEAFGEGTMDEGCLVQDPTPAAATQQDENH